MKISGFKTGFYFGETIGLGAWMVAAGLLMGWLGMAAAEDSPFPLKRGDWSMGVNGIYAPGLKILGSKESHDLALGEFQVGYVVTDLLAEDRFYRGTLELTAQAWGGWEVNLDNSYLFGITPGLRYHFDTGTSVVPYIGGGAGILATDIGRPDLSGHFQFNEQVGLGMQWFMKEDWALNLGYRFLHISNAGIEKPNRGVNNHMAVVGILHRF